MFLEALSIAMVAHCYSEYITMRYAQVGTAIHVFTRSISFVFDLLLPYFQRSVLHNEHARGFRI